jgi:KDO2-lipid IV(A) lauroyltransferase
MAALFYYLVVFPLSLLPLRVLYIFANCIKWIFNYLIPYRKKVIQANLKHVFPDKSTEEIALLTQAYYSFLADLIVESVKNLQFSAFQLKQHIQIESEKQLQEIQNLNKPIILVSSHYNNWEWLISALGLWFKRPTYGIGMPLSAAFWDKKLTQKRERFGLKVVHQGNYESVFQSKHAVILTLADQAPASSNKAYWTTFLGVQTPVIFGPEYLANRYDCAVVYADIKQSSRGHYIVSFEVITEDASKNHFGDISELHLQKLSAAIAQNPSRWLWSHKRWKRSAPENLSAFQAEAQARFEARFRN